MACLSNTFGESSGTFYTLVVFIVHVRAPRVALLYSKIYSLRNVKMWQSAAAVCSLLAHVTFVIGSIPDGVANPEGYVVFKYYKYAGCEGAVEETMATAVEICIPGSTSLRGEPYGNENYIYRLAGDFVEVWAFAETDFDCTGSSNKKKSVLFDACSTSGDAAYATFSATLPDLSLDGAIVRNVVYDTDLPACNRNDSVILTYALYTPECRNNCYFNNIWEYCDFPYCEGHTVNITYYDHKGRTSGLLLGHELSSSSCREDITCYNVSSNGAKDDGNSIQGWVVAVIVVVTLVTAAVVAVGVYYFKFGAASKSETAPLNENFL